MNFCTRLGLMVTAFALPAIATADAATNHVPVPQLVAPGVWLIPGSMLPNREPDGNSVIFAAPAGLVVMDSGRHEWQRQAILALASGQHRAIVAVVNSHWHLDHVSGNPALRAAYPGLRVYASNAIEGALSGFLAVSEKESAAYLDDPRVPEEARADIRGDMLTIQKGSELKPDVVVSASGAMLLGGRSFRINLAPNAATAGDLWLYDAASGVAAVGDLVTLPAPFLDTACPAGWKTALAQVAATPFKVVIPGHGVPMQREQFLRYQRAFESYIDCARSIRPMAECAQGWAEAVEPLLAPGPAEMQRAKSMASDYVEMLRANGGSSRYCADRRAAN